jgi:hypothetical protein
MTNDKFLIIYGFDAKDEETIKIILTQNQFPESLILKNSMAKMKISEIVSGVKYEIHDYKLPIAQVVLFYNFSDIELNKTFKEIKKALIKMPICAVVTDISVSWTLEYLVKHLIEEKKWHEKQSK